MQAEPLQDHLLCRNVYQLLTHQPCRHSVGRVQHSQAIQTVPQQCDGLKICHEHGRSRYGRSYSDARTFHHSMPDCRHVGARHPCQQAAGGTDNGPPGIRPFYGPGYYGAFVLDPEGNNVEAVNITHKDGHGH